MEWEWYREHVREKCKLSLRWYSRYWDEYLIVGERERERCQKLHGCTKTQELQLPQAAPHWTNWTISYRTWHESWQRTWRRRGLFGPYVVVTLSLFFPTDIYMQECCIYQRLYNPSLKNTARLHEISTFKPCCASIKPVCTTWSGHTHSYHFYMVEILVNHSTIYLLVGFSCRLLSFLFTIK